MKDFRILPEVPQDLAEIADWYDVHGYPGLGDRFIDTFYSNIPHICEDGEAYRQVSSGFRRILLKPFPYFLFYRYHQDIVVVSLVIGAVRKPEADSKATKIS